VTRASNVSVARAVAFRTVTALLKNPALFVPPMLFPLMSFAAFAGGLSRLSHIPDFDYSAGYTSFQFVFVLLQSAAFGGVFMGLAIARDFERGFARRLLLAAPSRGGLIAGYALGSLFRWSIVAAMLTVVGLAAGVQIGGGGIDVFGLYGLAVLVNLTAVLFAAGVATRIRTSQAGPLMQTPVFTVLFLAPVYVPLDLLRGWIHAVASVNPMTALLTAGRGLLAGDPEGVAIAFATALALTAAFAVWARLGLRRAEAAGGG
jgi:ABC-2 type transport system permease protein